MSLSEAYQRPTQCSYGSKQSQNVSAKNCQTFVAGQARSQSAVATRYQYSAVQQTGGGAQPLCCECSGTD